MVGRKQVKTLVKNFLTERINKCEDLAINNYGCFPCIECLSIAHGGGNELEIKFIFGKLIVKTFQKQCCPILFLPEMSH